MADTTGTALQALSRLESLPAELLDIVFDATVEWNVSKLTHPLSKALQPFVRRFQYRNIAVDYSHFLQLCQTIKDSSHQARLINSLVIRYRTSEEDFEVEQEDIVFHFFQAATSLEQFEGLEYHPLLQQRITSAKYALNCLAALRILKLDFAQDESTDLLQQSRYVSCFQSCISLSISFGGDTVNGFTEEERDKFEEMNRMELLRFGLAEYSPLIRIEGAWPDTAEVAAFVARFRCLGSFYLDKNDEGDLSSVLAAIDPAHFTGLLVAGKKDEGGELWGEDIKHLVNLEGLAFPGTAYTIDVVNILSKFTKLTEIIVLSPGDPSPSVVRTLLHPHTRLPALKMYDFRLSITIRFDSQLFNIDFYDPVRQGVALPLFRDAWTVDLVREMLALGEQEGIQLEGRESCEKAIRMTEEYWASQGIHHDGQGGESDGDDAEGEE